MKSSNNTVLITGGASGIGFALARVLIEQNNTVIICGRDSDKLNGAKVNLPQLITIKCDITKQKDLEELQVLLETRFPRLNILVNNAGIQFPMNFVTSEVNETQIDQEIQTNLTSHIKMTNRLLPMLSAQQDSAIVFTSSALAWVPKASAPVYCATKAGIHSFALSLRHQLSGTKTRVFEVVPDLVETAMTENRADVKKVTPGEVAKSVLKGLDSNKDEILIGRTWLLLGLHRLLPNVAHMIINKNV
jgi:uncharacterized oxidoreductase